MRSIPSRLRAALVPAALAFVVACGGSSTPARAPAPAPYGPYGQGAYGQPYPQQPYGPPPYNSGPNTAPPYTMPPPSQPGPATAPPQTPSQPPAAAQRPLLAPLVGSLAWRAEVKSVLTELIANLPPLYQAKVKGIPLVFENNPAEINAYAGCDEKGSSFMAGTEGILLAIDAISQTRATDELFGTRTYDQYTSTVLPQLVRSETAVPALLPGIIPAQLAFDVRRMSRAHELFDEITAFTFGHELAHHYLGHTGCANGDGIGGFNPAILGHIATSIVPIFNQPNELAADNFGVVNVLDSGRARRPQYAWSEQGGLMLLDFFGRLHQAGGGDTRFIEKYLTSHPDPSIRVPIVQTVSRTWYGQHPS